MSLHQQILKKSKIVDDKFIYTKDFNDKVMFKVPKNRTRYKKIRSYFFYEKKIEELELYELYKNSKNTIFVVDKNVNQLSFVNKFLEDKKKYLLLPTENNVKTKSFLDKFILENSIEQCLIIIIGGGLLCNCGAYIAEKTNSDYILFPSTVLSMADGALGGKVRANLASDKEYRKHAYKSYYEANAVFLDERFLESLSERQKRIGLVEIIKHGLFQSETLYEFLLANSDQLLNNNKILKKAIFWAADLKKVCLEVDPYETLEGSKKILRGGHDFSDKLEEDKKFEIPHGFAVSVGIIQQLTKEKNKELLDKARTIFTKLKIPKSIPEI